MDKYERAQMILEEGGVLLPALHVRTTMVRSATDDLTYVTTYGLDSDRNVRFWRCDCKFGRIHTGRVVEMGGEEDDDEPCAHVIASISRYDDPGSPV